MKDLLNGLTIEKMNGSEIVIAKKQLYVPNNKIVLSKPHIFVPKNEFYHNSNIIIK